MPAYHSVFLDEPNQQLIGNFALLPLRTRTRGPAIQLPALPADVTELTIDASHESYDPLDEILALFRANTFFRNFEIKGPADRVLIYGILYVSEVLGKIKPGMSRREAEKAVMNVALDTNFAIPGDAGFPLNQAFEAPADRNSAEVMRQYIMQMRQELATRLLNRVYADETNTPSKWWLSYTKRKFMGKALWLAIYSTGLDDPDWSYTFEPEDFVPSSDKNGRPRDGDRVSLEQERALLPYMPALLDDLLPPCGLQPQVAYGNVVRRLRKIWLQRALQDANNVPLVEICKWILQDLKIEAEDSPVGSEYRTKQRQPWRREDVFKYEICWTKYFVREAEVLEQRKSMSEEELAKQDFRDKLHPIPKELDIYVRKSCNKKNVLDSWKAWHVRKRQDDKPVDQESIPDDDDDDDEYNRAQITDEEDEDDED
ncbi:hypothetical protein CFE70_001790 [Pyrenophora teres f. teres 0-1]